MSSSATNNGVPPTDEPQLNPTDYLCHLKIPSTGFIPPAPKFPKPGVLLVEWYSGQQDADDAETDNSTSATFNSRFIPDLKIKPSKAFIEVPTGTNQAVEDDSTSSNQQQLPIPSRSLLYKIHQFHQKLHSLQAPPVTPETLKLQQILLTASKIPQKRSFLMQELALLSLRGDFQVTFGTSDAFIGDSSLHESNQSSASTDRSTTDASSTSSSDALMQTTPQNLLHFICKCMLIDLKNMKGFQKQAPHSDTVSPSLPVRIVFEYGNSHKHFNHYYEITERILLGLITLRNIVTKSWNRPLLASTAVVRVMASLMEFVVSILHSHLTQMGDLKQRMIRVWITKILFVLKYLASDILLQNVPREVVQKFFTNLEALFFLEEEEYGHVSLGVLEILHLLTATSKSAQNSEETTESSENAKQDESVIEENTQKTTSQPNESTDQMEVDQITQPNQEVSSGGEGNGTDPATSQPSTTDQNTTPQQSSNTTSLPTPAPSGLPNTTPAARKPAQEREVSVLSLIQHLHNHNITFLQYGLERIFPMLVALVVPTSMIIGNNTHIMCRSYALHLLRRIASTDLLPLSFKEKVAGTDCLLMRLISAMPIHPKPKIYIEEESETDATLPRFAKVSSLRNDEDLQRFCAEIAVGFSETQSAIEQLKRCHEKITMLCMIAPDEIAELMTNCLYSRDLSQVTMAMGDSMEEEISATVVEDTMEDED